MLELGLILRMGNRRPWTAFNWSHLQHRWWGQADVTQGHRKCHVR